MNSRWIFVAVVVIAFIVYCITAAPGVMFTDSGELAGACATLGVAHPTGYPLFTMLGHLWCLLPLPFSTIYKLNLFAAFCTALSAGVFYLLCEQVLFSLSISAASAQKQTSSAGNDKKSDKKKEILLSDVSNIQLLGGGKNIGSTNSHTVIAVVTALTYAFARTVWAQATSIEVYSLHLLMMMLVLYCGIKGVFSHSRRWLMLTALAFGLSFTNHQTTSLLIIPFTLLFFFRPNQKFDFSAIRRKEFLLLLAVLISCALVYLYLPLRSAGGAWFNWGAVHRGWEAFSYHVFGKQYSDWLFSGATGEYSAANQFKKFLGLVPYQLGFVGILFAIWGMVETARRSKQIMAFFSLLVLICLFLSINYSIHDIDSYFLTAFVVLLLFMAIGAAALIQRVPKTLGVYFLIPIIALTLNWSVNDEHDNVLVQEYVKMMVDPLPKNAVLISQQWDHFCSAFWYLQQVEGYRPDVVLIEKEVLRRTWYPAHLQRWYPDAIAPCKPEIDDYMVDLQDFERDSKAFNLNRQKTASIQRKFVAMINAFVSKNIASRPVFATEEISNTEPDFATNYGRAPYGMALQLVSMQKDAVGNTAAVQSFYSPAFLQAAQHHNSDHLEKDIARIASQAYTNNAAYYMVRGQLPQADSCFDIAVELDKKNRRAAEGLKKVREMMGNKQ